jgi:Family of unknown function (DUF5519)
MIADFGSQVSWAQLYATSSVAIFFSVIIPAAIIISIQIIQTIIHDYYDYLSLGPGGTPSTPAGYLRIKFLTIFALKDPYSPLPVPIDILQKFGYLNQALPDRHGDRPITRGIAPHRQINQRPSEEVFAELHDRINELAVRYPDLLVQKTSCLEKHGPGLFTRSLRGEPRRCGDEVCHAHPSDGSLHLTLHPADVAMVVRAGWGERHPLASGGWLRRFVPVGFTMVYAPRNESEVEVVMKIIKASVWWIGGVDVDYRAQIEAKES